MKQRMRCCFGQGEGNGTEEGKETTGLTVRLYPYLKTARSVGCGYRQTSQLILIRLNPKRNLTVIREPLPVGRLRAL